jgi:hypothetical protein
MEESFRINKRRKVVFRKRLHEDDDEPSDQPPAASAAAATNGSSGTAEPSVFTSDLHLVRRRPLGKRQGIAFTASGSQAPDQPEEQAMILAVQGQDGIAAANNRFIKPTGRVGVAEDKHLYVCPAP